tara:strand:+ start:61 stop:573 length:513 start_codon:yes stop_codon:yes gene_type:complete
MNKTTTTKLTAIFTANNAQFDRDCAIRGVELHDACDNTVDAIHAFGSTKNEDDAIASIVAGVVAAKGHAPNHLDFATRAKEAGVSLDGFYNGWNAGLKMMEDANYCIDTAPSVRRKDAYLTPNDKCHTLKQIWTGVPNKKRGKKTLQQLVNSLVKQHGRNAVVQCVENAG